VNEAWLSAQAGTYLPQRPPTNGRKCVSDEVVSFGPVEFLLKDPGVTELNDGGLSSGEADRFESYMRPLR
jgi:hypothetical protein